MIEERIRKIRLKLKLSQAEFGEKLGVSRDVISNIENDRVTAKQVFINHLCSVLSVNENWLNTGIGEMFTADHKEKMEQQELTFLFSSLTPELRKFALQQLKDLNKLKNSEFTDK